jgi:hypothetical protein
MDVLVAARVCVHDWGGAAGLERGVECIGHSLVPTACTVNTEHAVVTGELHLLA